jgi:hypothetical protein
MAEYTFHPSVSQHADTRSSRASTEGRETVERALRDHEGLIHAATRRHCKPGALVCGVPCWATIQNEVPPSPRMHGSPSGATFVVQLPMS